MAGSPSQPLDAKLIGALIAGSTQVRQQDVTPQMDAGGILTEIIALIKWMSAGVTFLYQAMQRCVIQIHFVLIIHTEDVSRSASIRRHREVVLQFLDVNGLVDGAILLA